MHVISYGYLFNPLPIQNTSKVVNLTHSWALHTKIIRLTLCHPELLKGFLINIFMIGAAEDHSFNPLPTKNILKVLK